MYARPIDYVTKKRKDIIILRAIMNGNCNDQPLDPIDNKDEYLVLADDLAHQTGGIAVVIYQIPNCKILYPADPLKRRREEDAMIAFAWCVYMHLKLPTSTIAIYRWMMCTMFWQVHVP